MQATAFLFETVYLTRWRLSVMTGQEFSLRQSSIVLEGPGRVLMRAVGMDVSLGGFGLTANPFGLYVEFSGE
jgi:hypothetical protein